MSKSKEARGILILLSLVAWSCVAADNRVPYRTPNFVVTAPTAEFAKQVGDSAEVYRRDLAIEWLGKEFPGKWSSPCPITVKVGQIGAGGATSFSFDRDSRGEMHVFGWSMTIQGSEERILDSVLPHEITHMVLACHFRCPLPRWADEGAATLAEHESEKRQQVLRTKQLLNSRQRIPLSKLVTIMQYPSDMREVLNLYAEGYSLVELLIQKGGKTGKSRYLRFLAEALRNGWDSATKKYYNYRNLDELETDWHKWIAAGSPTLGLPEGQILASDDPARRLRRNSNAIVRGQAPDDVSNGSVDVASTDLTKRTPYSAPSPKRSRIQRPAAAREVSLPQSVSLGEPSELGEPATDIERAPSKPPAERTAPAGEKTALPEDVAMNPGWSSVEESAEAPPAEAAPAAPRAYKSRRRTKATEEYADGTPENRNRTENTRKPLPVTESADAATEEPRAEPQPEVKPLRSITAYPRRKQGSPRWSEFPQVSRPSPFVDVPTVSRQ